MDIDGKYAKDIDGNRIPHFDRPIELMRLSTAEQLLIQRCANYVPSVDLSNGTFALKATVLHFLKIFQICATIYHFGKKQLLFSFVT